jgi:hypothetical protein
MTEERTIQLFREQIDANEIGHINLAYRVVGGLRDEPGFPPPVDELLTLEGSGSIARLLSNGEVAAESALDPGVAAELFRQVRANMADLVPRARARFVPDSIVGEITIEVAGEREQLYFLIEEQRQPQEAGMKAKNLADLHSIFSQAVDDLRERGSR